MDVEHSLNHILHSLRQSNLNFSAQETPYSLYLTVRKKKIDFQKQRDFRSSKSENYHEQNLYLKEKCGSLEKALEALKNDLESEISNNEDVIRERDELVKKVLKNDNRVNELELELKALKVESDSFGSSAKTLKKQLKEKDKIIHDLKEDNQKISDNNVTAKYEIKELNNTIKTHEKEIRKIKGKEKNDPLNNLKAVTAEIKCEICENKFDSILKLKVHVRLSHNVNNNTQTDQVDLETKSVQTVQLETNQKSYPCFYCHKQISSINHLKEHRLQCHGVSEFPSLFSLPILRQPP